MKSLPRKFLSILFGSRLPVTRGSIEVEGIEGRVEIRRDRFGIPHIFAAGEADAFFGLGFAQGQDRGFQIEALRRAVRGTLSELVGRAALPVDRLSRRIGFLRAARRQLEVLDPELRAIVEAFARGVDAGRREGVRRSPHELAILRARPGPYAAEDVRGLLDFLSFAMAANWDCELERLRVLEEDGPAALRALEPEYPAWLPVSSPPGAPAGPAASRLEADLRLAREFLGLGLASNIWAVAPSRTSSGRPILANDPHLPPMVPPHWYLAHIEAPGFRVRGASFAGTPAIIVGHNEHGAWGLTAGMADNTDLYVEEVGPDGRSVRDGEGFVPCEVVEERIAVRGRGEVVERVLVTPRGPIVSPALEGERRAISLRATWLEPLPIRGFMAVHRTRSLAEFRECFRDWPALSAGLAYAGADGTIAWGIAGRVPLRRTSSGLLPAPGWDPESAWEDRPVPFEEMPWVVDPPCGFVASANQKPVADGAGPFLGADWIDGYRMARISEALAERADWDVESSAELQRDERSLPWREIAPAILALRPRDARARKGLAILESWDGIVSADSAAAAVFELFSVEIVRRIVERLAPRSAAWALGKSHAAGAHRSVLSVRRSGWLARLLRERPPGIFRGPWEDELADALSATVARLERAAGPDPARWKWGSLRRLAWKHPLGANPILGRFFDVGPLPVGGDANTVAQAAVDPFDPLGNPLFTASLRAVIHVGLWTESRFALPGGESGNPASPHYDDQLARWQSGEGIAIPWSREEVEREARDALELLPRRGETR